MMNKISSCLKCIWLGGPSPGLCHATMTEVAPPVASVVRSTSMSRPKGLIDNACLGVTTVGCSGVRASMYVSPVLHGLLVRRGWQLSHRFAAHHLCGQNAGQNPTSGNMDANLGTPTINARTHFLTFW